MRTDARLSPEISSRSRSDEEEVLVADEVGGQDRGQGSSVPVAVAGLLDEVEVRLVVKVCDRFVLLLPAAGGEVVPRAMVFGEVLADLTSTLALRVTIAISRTPAARQSATA